MAHVENAVVGSGFAVGHEGQRALNTSSPTGTWQASICREHNYAFDSDHVRIWIMLDNFTISDVTSLPSEATSVECSIVRIAESGYPDYAILKAARPVTECKPLAHPFQRKRQTGRDRRRPRLPRRSSTSRALSIGSKDITATTGTVARHMTMTDAGNTNVRSFTTQTSPAATPAAP